MTLISVSWSGGVPSTGLVAGAIAGILPPVDLAIFADTGAETQTTYDTIEVWRPFVEAHGIDVVVIEGQDIIADTLDPDHHFASMPFFVKNPEGKVGRLKRQCTPEYKVRPIRRALRDYLGYSRRGRVPAGIVKQQLGYTREEIGRIKGDDAKWVRKVYPWIDRGWFRFNVVSFLEEFCQRHSLPTPSESACIICPFRDDWHVLPEIDRAIEFDEFIRDSSCRGVDSPVFETSELIPLSELVALRRAEDYEPTPLQMAFEFECGSGYCGL
ncbi:MAG: hypothetical protein V3W44_03620 [Dehalococcoidales bacterium]